MSASEDIYFPLSDIRIMAKIHIIMWNTQEMFAFLVVIEQNCLTSLL